LTADNVIVILDLHWNNSGTNQANSQEPMPDLNHAPAFWTSVATAFKSNPSVIFDLYNEPYPTSWSCWLNGAPAANDAHSISYLAWFWNPYNCASGPSLISDFSGAATAYGIGYKAHLLALYLGSGTPPTTPTVGTTPTVTPTTGTTPTPIPTKGVTPTSTSAAGTSCNVHYVVTSQWTGGFGANITMSNTGTTAINGWTLQFSFADGQTITQGWNGTFSQTGSLVTITNVSYNGTLAAGATLSSNPGFNRAWSGSNAVPTSFKLNGISCSTS